MPRAYKLTYNPGNPARGVPPRWRKIHRGQIYQWPAGSGKTDKVAYEAALAAWQQKKQELDQAEDRREEPAYLACIQQWEKILAIALQRGEGDWAKRAEAKRDDLKRRWGKPRLEPLTVEDTLEFIAFAQDEPGLATYSDYIVWKDRLKEHQAVPAGESVREQVQLFLDKRKERVESQQLSATRLVALKINLADFEKWIGGTTSVKEINGTKLLAYKSHADKQIAQGVWKPKTAAHKLEAVKCWVRWLWTTDALTGLPKVLSSKDDWGIKVPTKKIKDFTVLQVKQLLAGASPRTRLYLCLGLNCGMTQTDIANLRRDEINLAAHTITRKRTKTKEHENVPEVTYKLWKPTRELLQQHMATEGDLALVGEGGRPLLSVTLDKKTDAVRSAFARLLKKTSVGGTFKMLRKTSAGLLANSAWASLVDLFLGHAAAKLSDKVYAKAAMGRLSQATHWLAKKYGV